jgi:hypothetical protein
MKQVEGRSAGQLFGARRADQSHGGRVGEDDPGILADDYRVG